VDDNQCGYITKNGKKIKLLDVMYPVTKGMFLVLNGIARFYESQIH
jgi:hypothetical protein